MNDFAQKKNLQKSKKNRPGGSEDIQPAGKIKDRKSRIRKTKSDVDQLRQKETLNKGRPQK